MMILTDDETLLAKDRLVNYWPLPSTQLLCPSGHDMENKYWFILSEWEFTEDGEKNTLYWRIQCTQIWLQVLCTWCATHYKYCITWNRHYVLTVYFVFERARTSRHFLLGKGHPTCMWKLYNSTVQSILRAPRQWQGRGHGCFCASVKYQVYLNRSEC